MAYIETETRGHVLIITLNRPEARNAFNRDMAEEMSSIIDAYEDDKELRAAIIQANGPTFSAGQDLKDALNGDMAVTKDRGGFGNSTEGHGSDPSYGIQHEDSYELSAGDVILVQSGDYAKVTNNSEHDQLTYMRIFDRGGWRE